MRFTDVLWYWRNLERCVGQIQDWCTLKRLQLNPDKTELIWFGSKANLAKLKADELCLHLGSVDIKLSTVVQDLGIWLDSELTMHDHISRIACSCFFRLHQLFQLRVVVCHSTMQRLISALVLSRLNYCDAVLSGLPSTTLDPLQWVLNAAVHLVAGLGPRDHVTEQMKELHWLAIKYRINFKLCLMMHAVVTGQCPQYIRDIVHPLSTLPGQNRLWAAASGQFDIPRTRTVFGERAFSMAGSREWNTFPQDITDITNRYAFKRALKTYYFKFAYDC